MPLQMQTTPSPSPSPDARPQVPARKGKLDFDFELLLLQQQLDQRQAAADDWEPVFELTPPAFYSAPRRVLVADIIKDKEHERRARALRERGDIYTPHSPADVQETSTILDIYAWKRALFEVRAIEASPGAHTFWEWLSQTRCTALDAPLAPSPLAHYGRTLPRRQLLIHTALCIPAMLLKHSHSRWTERQLMAACEKYLYMPVVLKVFRQYSEEVF